MGGGLQPLRLAKQAPRMCLQQKKSGICYVSYFPNMDNVVFIGRHGLTASRIYMHKDMDPKGGSIKCWYKVTKECSRQATGTIMINMDHTNGIQAELGRILSTANETKVANPLAMPDKLREMNVPDPERSVAGKHAADGRWR